MLGSDARASLEGSPPARHLDISESVGLVKSGSHQPVALRDDLRDGSGPLQAVGWITANAIRD